MKHVILLNCQADYSKNNAMDNKGGEAINTATVESIRQYIPEAQFSTFMQLPDDLAKKIGIKVIKNRSFQFKPFSPITSFNSSIDLAMAYMWSFFNKYFGMNVHSLLQRKKLREFKKSDVLIHVGGDLYSDDYGLRTIVEHSKDIITAHLLNKPVVIYAESLGPFDSRLSSWIARNALNRANLITVREEISKQNLDKLGVNVPPIYITADPAFLFKPAPRKRVQEILAMEGISETERPIIGVTMGNTNLMGSAKKSNKVKLLKSLYYKMQYVLPESIFRPFMLKLLNSKCYSGFSKSAASSETIAKVIDYCIEKYNAKILLIPHVIPLPGAFFDDRNLLQEIYSLVNNKNSVKNIGNYSGDELKGIIGSCDMFIGAKMHATIAATSQSIPTVAIAFGHKFFGVFRILGLEKYVCSTFNDEELIKKIDEVWVNSDEIKKDLSEKMVFVKQRSLLNAKLVKDLLDIEGK